MLTMSTGFTLVCLGERTEYHVRKETKHKPRIQVVRCTCLGLLKTPGAVSESARPRGSVYPLYFLGPLLLKSYIPKRSPMSTF